jgi:GT2 family glycosyltransferase
MIKNMEIEVSASLVLYKNKREEVERVVRCFLSVGLNTKLFLVDNSPTDELKNLNIDSSVTYIHTGNNVGFGAGHNIAIRKMLNASKYHIVLNPDIYFDPDTIIKLHAFMEQNPDIGHVMPKIVYPDGQIQYVCKLLPNPFDLFMRRFLPKSLVKDAVQFNELRFTGYNRIMDIPYLSGCFMFLRCKALESVGLFDERFFMYPEDIDLTRRIHDQFRTVFYPFAQVVHEHGKASYKSFKMLYIHTTNMIRYFNKWGWIFDMERRRVNKRTLDQFEELKNKQA